MGIIDKFWKIQHRIEDRARYIGKGKYGRVLKMARKPSSEEFNKTSIVVGIGVVLIGGLGFLLFLLWKHVPNFFGGLLGI